MDEELAIEIIGKRGAYEDGAEKAMSIVAGAGVMPSSMTMNLSRDRGGLLHRLEAEEITSKETGRMVKGDE